MMTRLIGIIVVSALILFGGYKIFSNKVSWDDPKSVGTAFLKAVKAENFDRAKKYYVPAEADAWAEQMTETLRNMKSNAHETFQNSIPDKPEFVSVPSPKGSTDTTFKAGDVTLGMRQIEGNWYVSKSPY